MPFGSGELLFTEEVDGNGLRNSEGDCRVRVHGRTIDRMQTQGSGWLPVHRARAEKEFPELEER
jgi:hypothetical protein